MSVGQRLMSLARGMCAAVSALDGSSLKRAWASCSSPPYSSISPDYVSATMNMACGLPTTIVDRYYRACRVSHAARMFSRPHFHAASGCIRGQTATIHLASAQAHCFTQQSHAAMEVVKAMLMPAAYKPAFLTRLSRLRIPTFLSLLSTF